MRATIAALLALLLLDGTAAGAAPAKKRPEKPNEFANSEQILRWINGYRTRPDPDRMPVAIKAASNLNLFREMDSAGIYVGFVAGVLQTNPDRAEELIGKLFPMPPEDQVVIIERSPTLTSPTGRS